MKRQLKVRQKFVHQEETQIGRYRKKHALDCGNPQCGICHSSKILQIATHKQNIKDLDFREQLKEAG